MTMTRDEALRQVTAVGQPHELADGTVFGRPCRVFVNAPSSLRDLYADNRSDATFLVYEDECLTFEETWQRACSLAHVLVDRFGVRAGDRVAITMRNYPEWVIAFMAATSIGAIAVAMNAHWQPDEMAFALNDCTPRVLIADRERLERLSAISAPPADMAVISVRCRTNAAADWAKLVAAPFHCSMPDRHLDPEDDTLMLYTSGSTGYPKGAVSCHRNVLSALMSWEADGQAAVLTGRFPAPDPDAPQGATLLGVPLFHATGSHAVFLQCYRAQRRMICMYRWDVAEAARLIEHHRITQFIAPSAMTGDLVHYAHHNDGDLSSLATVGGGGAARAPEQVLGIENTFANARPNTGWGMTETNAIGTSNAGDDYVQRPASSGRCSVVLELRTVDEQGRVLGPDQRGELQIRGTSIFRGYWQRPEANAESFDGDWLKTGDVAYLDDDGFLFIVDRIKDMVIRGGENIGCGAVEAALQEHEHVVEACVYAVPDDRLGEEVGATLYADRPVTPTELQDFLRARLAAFEVPRYLHIVSEPLPRTASGKILKRQLREEAAKRL